MPFQAYILGWKQIKKHWQLVMILFVTILLIALLISLPLQSALVRTFGFSRVAQDLVTHFQLNHLIELFTGYPLLFQQLTENFFYAGLIYLALMLFFAGGIIQIYATRNSPFSLHFFLAAALENWARMVRLFLIRLLGILFLGLFWLLLYSITFRLLDTQNEVLLFRFALLELGIMAGFFLILTAFLDYTGIVLVLEEPRLYLALKKATHFVKINFWGTVSLFLLNWVTLLLFIGTYWLLAGIFPFEDARAVWPVLAVQQFFILSRTCVRLLFYAGPVEFLTRSKVFDPGNGYNKKLFEKDPGFGIGSIF